MPFTKESVCAFRLGLDELALSISESEKLGVTSDEADVKLKLSELIASLCENTTDDVREYDDSDTYYTCRRHAGLIARSKHCWDLPEHCWDPEYLFDLFVEQVAAQKHGEAVEWLFHFHPYGDENPAEIRYDMIEHLPAHSFLPLLGIMNQNQLWRAAETLITHQANKELISAIMVFIEPADL